MELTCSIEIQAPPEEVWRVMSDIGHWPEWTPTVTSVELLYEGDLAVGSQAKLVQPRVPELVWTVTRLEPGRGFEWESAGRGFRSVAGHWIAPVNGNRSSVRLTVKQSGPLVVVMGWYLRRIGRRYIQQEAEGLKKRVEQRSGQAAEFRKGR